MIEQNDMCGLFGKLPQQGDFVSHFLPEGFTEHWHHWLQACLSVSREQLGPDWMDYYLTSPVWRFAIMPNVITDKAVVGVMIPSVDEVGRYFPLTVAHLADHHPWSAYRDGAEWYQHVEKVALLALDDAVGYTQFVGRFEQLELPEFPPLQHYVTDLAHQQSRDNAVVDLKPDQSADDLTLDLLTAAHQRIYGNYSLWWTEGSEFIPSSLLVSSQLPDAGQFAAMLDGNWTQWGWNKEAILSNDNKPPTE
ncbi:type VI secretion system-associated protein TagF [Aurantivibrio plasticivorans]